MAEEVPPTKAAGKKSSAARRTARVLVVDGEAIVCEAIVQLIAGQTRLTVCGRLTEGRKLVQAVECNRPDLVLFDLMLKDCDGIETLKQFKILFPMVPVLVLCGRTDCASVERSMRAGAGGYVGKWETARELFEAIELVLAGEMRLNPKMQVLLLGRLLAPARLSAVGRSDPLQLTEGETRIFALIGAGLRMREIATRLGRSVKTIEAHREHIRIKLGLRNSAEVTERATHWLDHKT
ncbi:MAG TPA: response regulator transcription factor [Chthoniobacterales bacterium]|nr:response regulator transcription factor [Chthoniobacterales bacterium]